MTYAVSLVGAGDEAAAGGPRAGPGDQRFSGFSRSPTLVLKFHTSQGPVAQSGSASRSQREGQGFKSPQVHSRPFSALGREWSKRSRRSSDRRDLSRERTLCGCDPCPYGSISCDLADVLRCGWPRGPTAKSASPQGNRRVPRSLCGVLRCCWAPAARFIAGAGAVGFGLRGVDDGVRDRRAAVAR